MGTSKKRYDLKKSKVAVLVLMTLTLSLFANESSVELENDKKNYDSKHFAIGVGVGVVKFNTNLKISPSDSGRSLFLDVEGNFDLPDMATVNIFYAAYRFNDNHSILINYFGVNRSTSTISIDQTFGDIYVLKANVDIYDKSKFYNLAYGYTLFRNQNGSIVFVAGLNTINLNYSLELKGELSKDGVPVSREQIINADVYAPLPLIGLNYKFKYTKKFAVSTKVSIVGGKYQNIKAAVLHTTISSIYNVTDHIGLRLGLSYFDATIAIDNPEAFYKVNYGYKGVNAGVHFAF